MVCSLDIERAYYSNRAVVEDIHFNVNEGEFFAIVGESGAGKTTIGRILSGLWRFYPLKFDGVVKVKERVSLIPQNVSDSLDPLFRVESQLKEITKDLDKIKAVLCDVGFDDVEGVLKSYPPALSGGMKQRVLIASSLLVSNVILADEFTSALDNLTKFKIIKTLKKLNEKNSTTVIFITHDLELLPFSDRMMVMFGGRIVEMGKTGEILNNPFHPYTAFLVNSMLDFDMNYKQTTLDVLKIDMSFACPFYRSCKKAKDICKNKKPPLKTVNDRSVRCHF